MPQEQKQEFWRWTESKWIDPKLKFGQGDIVTAGIDVGSVSSQAVIMVNNQIYAYSNIRTGSDSPQSAERALNYAIEETSLSASRIDYYVGTGYGRANVPMADRTVSEISCHAKGAIYIYGKNVRTILDVGGQDCKVIQCNEEGKIIRFLMNDKCAAGTGRGMEVLANLIGVSIEELGEKSLQVENEPDPISSTCVVYAKNEVISLLRKGWPIEKVLAAYCLAMTERIFSLVQKIGVIREFVITGGLAKNRGIVARLEKRLGFPLLEPGWDTQIAGALGAALFGQDLALRGEIRKRPTSS
jgi:benzoyl-CoA reductase subunit A